LGVISQPTPLLVEVNLILLGGQFIRTLFIFVASLILGIKSSRDLTANTTI